MQDERYVKILEESGIRATSTRIMLLKHILELKDTFSLGDLEEEFHTIDKSTLFRTLSLFQEHHLIHNIEDGSGAMKYCLCRNNGDCAQEEFHCHFYCEKCKKTYCLDESAITNITLPDGFVMNQVNYIVKGICDKCSRSER